MKKVHVPLMNSLALAAVLCSLQGMSQTRKLDSLKAVLSEGHAGDSALTLWAVSYELFDVDNTEALRFAEMAYRRIWKDGDSLDIVKVGTTYGQLLRRMDRVDDAITISSRLLPISRRHDFRKYTKMLLNSLAQSNMQKNEFDKALEYHLESLDLRKVDGDKKEIAIALHNIAIVYYRLEDPRLALEYCYEALNFLISHSEDDIEFKATIISDIGFCYSDLSLYDSALLNFDLALKVCGKRQGLLAIELSEMGIGSVKAKLGSYAEAKTHLGRSLKLAKSRHSDRYQVISLLYLADVSISEMDITASKYYLSKIESIPSIKTDHRLLMEYYKRKSRISFDSFDYKEAAIYLKKYIAERDSAMDLDVINALRRRHIAYVQKENLTRISHQNEVLKLNEDAIVAHQWLIMLCIFVIVLVVALAILLYRANRRKNMINRILDCRVKERTIELGRQRDALQHTVDEQVIARRRTSEELVALAATLKGLLHVAGKENPSNQASYFELAEAQADHIVRAIEHFKASGKLKI